MVYLIIVGILLLLFFLFLPVFATKIAMRVLGNKVSFKPKRKWLYYLFVYICIPVLAALVITFLPLGDVFGKYLTDTEFYLEVAHTWSYTQFLGFFVEMCLLNLVIRATIFFICSILFLNGKVANKSMYALVMYGIIYTITLIVLALMFYIRTNVIKPFTLVGSSMSPTYVEGSFMRVGLNTEYERDDVVIFVPPNKEIAFMNRIISVGGDIVKFDKANEKIYVCDDQDICTASTLNYMDEPFENRPKQSEYRVPEGAYFTMGDNRNASSDSRVCFGSCYREIEGGSPYITDENIIGKVMYDLGVRSQRK